MEHLLTETLLVGRIRLKFDAIRLPEDSFCRLSAGTMSENLWNVCRKISQSRANMYLCDRRNLIYDACGICKIDYYKNVEDCTSSFCKTIHFSTTKLERVTEILRSDWSFLFFYLDFNFFFLQKVTFYKKDRAIYKRVIF